MQAPAFPWFPDALRVFIALYAYSQYFCSPSVFVNCTPLTPPPPGHGRHVDPELVCALTSTAATAAHELAVLADTCQAARGAMRAELGLARRLDAHFLQVGGTKISSVRA